VPCVSSRIRSEFGSLEERLHATPRANTARKDPTPTTRWVLVDGQEQALLIKWRPDGLGSWQGLIARAGGADDAFAEWLPASRIIKHTCR